MIGDSLFLFAKLSIFLLLYHKALFHGMYNFYRDSKTACYGLKKREEAEAEAAAAAEEPAEGSLTRPKKLVPAGCGDEEEEESIMDTVMKYLPGPLQDMLKK
ncbi:hypothetical protein JOQ06_012651 [Pogonophryne albipinna]|uniref:Complexin-1 n=1 Tax=Pogonophryne albipinna TaxID=1090488 RepID=A0AAD6FSC2_9TELE|nr:hypothetical protein JOQ06_012651 [Pogonophryne albipinna]